MKIFQQMFFVFILIGCQSNENKSLDSKILGKWVFASEYFITRYDNEGFEEPPPPPREHFGYNFFTKDSCEANQMFVDLTTFDVDYYQPIGRKTIYKIEDDSLKIFNKTLDKWESFYMMRLDNNNLVLNHKNTVIQKFVRVLKD